MVETNIALELNEEKQARKEMEQRILKKVDEKIYGLRIDVSKDQKNREEAIQKEITDITDQATLLQNELEIERRTRYVYIQNFEYN